MLAVAEDEVAGSGSPDFRLWPVQLPPSWRLWGLAAAVFVGASIGQWLSHDGGHVASLWPPNGIALAILLLSPPQQWLGFVAAAWLGNTASDAAFGNPPLLAAALAAVNVLEFLSIAWAMRRLLGRHAKDLTRATSLIWFAAAGVAIPAVAACLAGCLLHEADERVFWSVATVWYPAHVLGLGIIAPMVLTWRRDELARLAQAISRRSTAPLLAVFAATTVGVFCQTGLPLLFFPIPPLLWVVVRLGTGGAAGALAFLAIVSLTATLHGLGPLSLMVDASLHGKVLFLQVYLLIATAEALGVAAVIAERGRLTRAVERSANTFRLLAEHASDIISRVGRDGTRFYVSPASERLLGIAPQELCGQGMFDRIHPEDQPHTRTLQRRLLQGLDVDEKMAFRAFHADGRLVWLESTARLLREPITGRLDGYVTVMRDVTEREERSAEQAQRRLKLEAANSQLDRLARHLARARDQADEANLAKSRFVASMSHELRTPLNGILGYAQLLRLEGGLNPTQALRVDAMLRSGRHLLELVNNVLDVSQIEAGRVDVVLTEIDAIEVCTTCLELVRPSATEKDLDLAVIAEPGLAHVMADKGRLRQVMVNLLGNAIKFTLSGSVTLRLAGSAAADGSATVRLEVIDTGPGVPAAKRDRLFRQFQRLDAASGPVEGAGLGLAISRHLVELMEGTIGFADNVPGGSVFWLELPAVSLRPATASTIADMVEAAPSRHRLRTMVVDDVSMNRDVAKAFLRAGGHHAFCVESGEAAVAAASLQDFDVILMDVRMPGMDGLEATRRIRELPGRRGLVPIVALTAHAFLDQVQECRRAGMDAHVVKPFDPTTLLDTVRRVAAGRSGQPMPAAQDPARSASAAASATPPSTPTFGPTLRPMVSPTLDPRSGHLAGHPPGYVPGHTPEPADPQGELPVLDRAAFDRTAELLAPHEVRTCLMTLQARADELLRLLRKASGRHDPELGEAAHTMAGSAGMFGFAQVVSASRRMETSMRPAAPDETSHDPGAAASLATALDAMRSEISHHLQSALLVTMGDLP